MKILESNKQRERQYYQRTKEDRSSQKNSAWKMFKKDNEAEKEGLRQI